MAQLRLETYLTPKTCQVLLGIWFLQALSDTGPSVVYAGNPTNRAKATFADLSPESESRHSINPIGLVGNAAETGFVSAIGRIELPGAPFMLMRCLSLQVLSGRSYFRRSACGRLVRAQPGNKLGRVDVEGDGHAHQAVDGHVDLAPLDMADVGPMQTGLIGQALLGHGWREGLTTAPHPPPDLPGDVRAPLALHARKWTLLALQPSTA